jgi:hypothetical protein
MTNPLRRLPALVLFVVLGLLPLQAWLRLGGDRLVAADDTDGVHGVTWVGNVSPDGRLSVRITYDLGDESQRLLDVRVPDGARYLTVDGVPIAADIGKYADDVPVSGTAVVAYELPGAVTRHADGGLLRLLATGDGYLDGDASMFPCPRCYIEPAGYGDVPVDGAVHYRSDAQDDRVEVPLWTTGLDSLHAESDPGAVRFVGVGDGDAVAMLAVLPASAVPDAPLADGRAAAVVDRVRTDVEALGERLRAPSSGDGAGVAVALLLTAMYAALVAWAVRRLRRAGRERDPRGDVAVPVGMDAIDTRPSGLEPALAAFTVGGAGRGDRSAVAGTLLELARRRVIKIEGIDSQRFTLTIPPGARGSTPFEEAVLARLRPQGQIDASATMTGPPLWDPEAPAVTRSLGRLLAVQAFRHRLARLTLSMLVLVPVSVAMGLIAVIATEGRSKLAWFVLVGGPLLAVVAAITSGLSLTAAGREERRRWIAYADWLRSNTQLANVGVPGIAIWGEVLPHAAALGAAPVAAEALSPR